MERKKTGRPSKGNRSKILLRIPPTLADALRAEAARRSMTLNDFLASTAAREVGLPYSDQEALPIPAA